MTYSVGPHPERAMGDRKLFYEDAARDRVETEVVERGEADGKPFVRLRETVF